MRYVIVSVVKGGAGNFNNNLRKEVFEKFHAKSSKLPAHFTIKAPFECENTDYMDNIIENFCKKVMIQVTAPATSIKIIGIYLLFILFFLIR